MPALLGSSNARSPVRYMNGVSCRPSLVGVTSAGSSSTSSADRFSSSQPNRRSALGLGFHDVPGPSWSWAMRNFELRPIASARREPSKATLAAAPVNSCLRVSTQRGYRRDSVAAMRLLLALLVVGAAPAWADDTQQTTTFHKN